MNKTILLILAGVLAAGFFVAALFGPVRRKLQDRLVSENHEVLATAEGALLGDGSIEKVIKYRGSEGIYVEIVKNDGSANGLFIDRILLPDKRDGLFNYQGRVTRLAIGDIDGDGKNELLAPSFDAQLVPHLNVFRYNSKTLRFEHYQPPSGSPGH